MAEPALLPLPIDHRARKFAGISSEQLRAAVTAALVESFPSEAAGDGAYPCSGPWIQDLFDDAAVFELDGQLWRVTYTLDPATLVATVTSAPERVVRTYAPLSGAEALKGALGRARGAGLDLRLKRARGALRLLGKEGLLPIAPAPVIQAPPAPGAAPLVSYQGIPVQIDRPRGFVQTGVDAKGVAWKRVYHTDYGFVPGTKGGDGEGLDVYLGLEAATSEAYWIVQQKEGGEFDEYKLMLGFPSAEQARAMYLLHTPKQFFRAIVPMSIEMVKALLGIDPSETLKKAACSFRALEDAGVRAALALLLRDGEVPVETEPAQKYAVRLLPTSKAEEQRYVLGIVLEPEVVDAQGEIYSAEEIRKASWQFMKRYRNVGLSHKRLINDRAAIVDNFITPVDMTVEGSVIKAGTWLMGTHVTDDALWSDVKKGELSGLSIGGWARVESL